MRALYLATGQCADEVGKGKYEGLYVNGDQAPLKKVVHSTDVQIGQSRGNMRDSPLLKGSVGTGIQKYSNLQDPHEYERDACLVIFEDGDLSEASKLAREFLVEAGKLPPFDRSRCPV